MGIFDGGGSNTSTTTFKLAPEQQEMLKLAMPHLREYAKNPAPPPTGTSIAPFNPTQTAAQEGALAQTSALGEFAENAWSGGQFLQGGDVLGSTPFGSSFDQVASGQYGSENPAYDSVNQVLGLSADGSMPNLNFFSGIQSGNAATSPIMGELAGMASGGNVGTNPMFDYIQQFVDGSLMSPGSNPALQAAIDAAVRPIVENTMEVALPGVRQDFVGAGQYGGTRQGLAEGQAINSMQRNVGDTAATMANRAYETGLQGTLQGLGLQGQAHAQEIDQMLNAAGLRDTAFGRQLEARLAAGGRIDDAAARDIQNMLSAAGLQDSAFGRQLASIIDSAGVQNEAYGNELDAMTRALGLAPQTAGLSLLPSQITSAVGDTRYGLESAQAQEAYQQKQLKDLWPLLTGQEIAGTAAMIPGGSNVTKTPQPEMNPFSALLGGLGLFGGMGSMLGFL